MATRRAELSLHRTTYVDQVGKARVYGERAKSGSFWDSLSISRNVKGITILMLAIFVIFGYFRIASIQDGYRIVEMQREVIKLSKMNEGLNLEVAELKSPSRIQRIAQKELGMVLPSDFVYSSGKASAVQSDVTITIRLQNQ